MAKKVKTKSEFSKEWIMQTALPIIKTYPSGLTLRALHYRLVAAGMTNDIQHYKKVVHTMTNARWEGEVHFSAFVDHERGVIGLTAYNETTVESQANRAKQQIKNWADSYSKNRWENQPIYPEVFIEKKRLQGVFEDPCRKMNVALNPCKGYPSLTFLYDCKLRFDRAIEDGKEPIILYFGDYDCSGEDIPRSIQENLSRMGTEVEVRRIVLMKHQVIKWKLPPAPTKATDSRGRTWDGLGQVELDAVEPTKIAKLCEDAIDKVFNEDLYRELSDQEETENEQFKKILKRDFKSLLD